MMNKILTFLILLIYFNVNAYALEITKYVGDEYRINQGDLFSFKIMKNHYITVALDDIDSVKLVSCTILENGKPIAKKSGYVDGVGTMHIVTNQTSNNSARCKEVEEERESWWKR